MRLERDLPYWALVALAAVWVGLAVWAPYDAAQGGSAAGWIYLAFHSVCHQLPERSFHAWGEPLAVCHRCFGLYLGLLGGLLGFPYLRRLRDRLIEHPRWVVVFAVPMLIDVALGPWNRPWDRFATGFLAAFPVALLAWLAMTQLCQRNRAPRKESYEPH